MISTQAIKLEEKNRLLLKVIMWAQKHKRQVEDLSRAEIYEAIRCKF